MNSILLFIELINSVTSTIDTILGPYVMTYRIVKVGDYSVFKNYFNCDLPMTFNEYLIYLKYKNLVDLTTISIFNTISYESDFPVTFTLNEENIMNVDFLVNSFFQKIQLNSDFPLYSILQKNLNFTFLGDKLVHNVYKIASLEVENLIQKQYRVLNGLYDYSYFQPLLDNPIQEFNENIVNSLLNNYYLNKVTLKFVHFSNENPIVLLNIVTNSVLLIFFSSFIFNFFIFLKKRVNGFIFFSQILFKEHDK